MKKLAVALFFMGLFIQGNAQSDFQKILGKWKYSAEADYAPTGGIFIFSEKNGDLKGEVAPDDGGLYPMTKIEWLANDSIYFEIKPEYDIIEVTLKFGGKKLKGIGSTYQGKFELTAEKQEE